MYDYRKWNDQQRREVVADRRFRNFPCHQPPHVKATKEYRIVTGTCFEHRPFLDSPQRLDWFENTLLTSLKSASYEVRSWVVLPNHYHLLLKIPDIEPFAKLVGRIHGRTSFQINREDKKRGRRVWFQYTDRVMRSDRHFYTTINYLHHNPVKHGYVDKQNEWRWSSFHTHLEQYGRRWLIDLWRDYPVREYGNKWDR